ncbi:MAG: GNAT family N-acetyltransferase, partial [Thermodesulfobacteriota bacterium]
MANNIRIEIPDRLNMTTCHQLVDIQRSAWGMSDLDILPPWKLFVAPQIGSKVIVTYEGDRAIAYALLSLAGDRSISEQHYLYLDMIGVHQSYQSHNLGFRIMQEAQALARSECYAYIAWTYDPLEGANASLYLKKLGAIATKYYDNYYGELSGERHRGTATDRFWTILYPNAEPKMYKPSQIISEADYNSYEMFQKKAVDLIGIEIPRDFIAIRDREPERANRIRLATRRIFQHLFANG